jgi:hypothetical protein
MTMFNHSYIDLLKMDIEGYEYEFMDQESSMLNLVGQFLVEVHVIFGNAKKWFASQTPLTFLERTEKENQRLFHQEINKIVPNVGMELSFLHSQWTAWDRMHKRTFPNPPILPTHRNL